ncbi:MAG: DegV family protein [SAR202 cluster bacterium]|nr:DegV family protein [SAR202 cluster bacterium]
MAVRVVTDSTSDLPTDLVAEHGITVVPLNVHFGAETLRDGVDITPDAFFQRLPGSRVLPKTSQPSVAAFGDVYGRLLNEGHEIVSVHISEKLSGTMNSARQAAQEAKSDRIEVVDTQGASLWVGLVALEAARAAEAGGTREEVARVAREASFKVRLFFVLDTLEYLQKGGRIGKAQALLGSLLSIKPVLTVREGEVHPHERVRTRVRALERIRELMKEGSPYDEIAVVHATSPDEARSLATDAASLSKRPVITTRVGPVIGVYTGPGLIGVAMRKP